ncbi:MAG: thiolase family protein [Bacteroidetes bacterium]|nr:thiolase family protein [Bacteroidota bacterium]MCL5738065.1 thiolase family protein [Bacteroidota bacterium]
MRQVVIASACRTPIGSFQGALSSFSAPRLGSIAIQEAVRRAGISPQQVEEVFMGCVLTAGVGQAPARQAAIFAGLPNTIPCTTINKVCGSGLKSVMLGALTIMTGEADIVVAGGMESMSNAPYLLEKARTGYRMGDGKVVDSMVKDGLWDVYNDYHMGSAAELCSRECHIPREAQDEFAVTSYRRALEAIEKGYFKDEIVPVPIKGKDGTTAFVEEDEEPRKVKFEKISQLKPAFEKDGTVTAANASKLNDGAAALVLMSEEKARELGIKPLAKIVAQASTAQAPEWFTTAPATVIQKLFTKTNLKKEDIDLFEINEAFSVVSLAVKQILELDLSKVDVHGGAVALGHPIGASGARILTTLIYAMQRRDARKGIAAICIGGGEAAGVIIER